VAGKAAPAVLIVEDESIVAHDVQQTLADLGYDAFAIAASAEEALARATERRPDVALVDIRIKGRLDGIRTAQLLQERLAVPIIYLTAHADEATLERAKQTRPDGYLLKPVKSAALRSAIEIALHKHEKDEGEHGSPAALPKTATPGPLRRGRAPGARVVRRQLEQVLKSEDFDASRRSREFLRFVVEEALCGRGETLSQAAIATQVFGRKDDFDPVVDPIVRIQAGRLRRSLERYYLRSGWEDPVRIELPKGTYVPAFRAPAGESPAPAPADARTSSGALDDWPLVAVSPFQEIPPSPEQREAASRLLEVLAAELSRYRDVRVVLQRAADALEPAQRDRARFALGGRCLREDDGLRVSAYLVDRTRGEQIWGDEYHTAPKPERWSGPLDDVARVIAARVGSEEGVVVQHLTGEYRKQAPAEPTPYGALLRAYNFFLMRDPADFATAVEALQRVVAAEPECGPAWTRLARLYVANYSLEVTDTPTPIDQAVSYALNGVRVDPTSRRARCVLASAMLMKGELAAGRLEVEQALRLTPDSLVYLEMIGWLLILFGDWERGPAISRRALERNPHCLPHVSHGLWLDHLRRGEPELAFAAALAYRDPAFFWRSLMRACCLGQLGRRDEATAAVDEVLLAKPDFPARGRILIGHFVKFPEVMETIVDGLRKAGLELD
jgi:adenylate cyclase